MKLRSILSEAGRNLSTGTTRALTFALLLAGTTSALATADALIITGIQSSASHFVASGSAIRVMTAPSETDGVTCERLAEVDGVPRAGALREADPTSLTALPRSPIATFEASPGLSRLLGIDTIDTTGVWVSRALATSLAVEKGGTIDSSAGKMAIAAIYEYPDDGRDVRLGFAIIAPTPAGDTFDECWALVWPNTTDRDTLLRSATTAGAGQAEPITITQLNKTNGASFDGQTLFEQRITRWAPAAATLLGFGLGWFSVVRRRLEHASALHAGQPRTAFTLTVLLETTFWAALAIGIGTAVVSAVLGVLDPTFSSTVYLSLLQTLIAGAGATLVGAAIATLTAREKLLFRYFKDRP